MLSEGVVDATKTDIDLDMVRQGQAAIQDLIWAEKELDEIVEYARILRLEFEDFDQESGFFTQVEDGHIESMDPEQVPHVDRKRIEKWMGEEDEKLEDPVEEMDDWECKTVDVNDSVSIVAT